MTRSIIIIASILMFPLLAFAGPEKVDLLLQIAQDEPYAENVALGKALDTSGAVTKIQVLIKTADIGAAREAVNELGGNVMFELKTIIGADIPIDSIDALSDYEFVDYIEAARTLHNKIDTARYYGNVDIVQGDPLSDHSSTGISFTGSGVVVGVVDDGLDYAHTDFQGSDGTSRIQYMGWLNSAGTKKSCLKSNFDNGNCSLGAGGAGYSHGTHVTSIATSSNSTYKGMAPESDIMFFWNYATDADSGGALSTAVLDAVTTLFSKATELKEAAVVNLSLGTSLGAHDGTSLLEAGLDELTGAGRIIVNAAGNEQLNATANPSYSDYGGIHATVNVPDGSAHGFRALVQSSNNDSTTVDIWLREGTASSCKVGIYAYQPRGIPSGDVSSAATIALTPVAFNSAGATDSNSDVEITIDVEAANAQNSLPHALISIEPVGSGTAWRTGYSYDVVIQGDGDDCVGDMWLYFDAISYHDFLTDIDTLSNTKYTFSYQNGDSFKTTTIPGTATNVIAAGSFMPEKPIGSGVSQWENYLGNTYSEPDATGGTVSDVSAFSSLGPTADGRQKPLVVAPGEPIIAALASAATGIATSDKVSSTRLKMQGTSQASPFLAGIVALLLQKNNCLTVAQVKNALVQGASTTGMTSVTSDAGNTYGSGKVNALSAIQSFSADTSCYEGGGSITPDDDDGGSSSNCGLIVPATNGSAAGATLAMLLPLLLVSLRRKR